MRTEDFRIICKKQINLEKQYIVNKSKDRIKIRYNVLQETDKLKFRAFRIALNDYFLKD